MTTKLFFSALAFIPSTLALSSVLNLTTPAANAFEVERGNHGASRIIKAEKSEAKTRRSTIIIHGPRGAQKLVTQEGVGGSTGEYKGFPKLEQSGSHGAYHIVND